MELIIAVIGALFGVGGIAAIIKARSENKKTVSEAEKVDADTEVTLGGGWKILWETSRHEVNELRERLAVVEKSDKECKERLAKLETLGNPDFEKRVAKLIAEEVKRMEEMEGGPVTRGRRTKT